MTEGQTKVRLSGSAVLWRRGAAGCVEVFWVRRGEQLRFAGGFYAFAGGRVDEADAALPVPHASDPACVAATARELFEETGVLAVDGAERISAEERAATRRGLLEDRGRGPGFGAFVQRHGLRIEGARFPFAGRWITPPQMPVRFDARFYLVELPEGQAAEVWPGELSDGEWITPAAALQRWEAGSALLHPPAWHILRCLALPEAQAHPDNVQPLLADPSRAPWKLPIESYVVQRIEFQRGVMVVPLRSETLPPATHTNCFLLGEDDLWVVDPGSPWQEEQALLERSLESLAAEGRTARGILLTHEHVDHVAGAMALSAKLGLPVAASALTAARLGELQSGVRIDKVLTDGEPLELGAARWRCLVLPGHTRGHTCLFDDVSRAVIAGDLVAGVGTVIIDPPDGDMADYLASLHRLIDLGPGTLYPAHGPVIAGGVARLSQYVAHRLEREEKVFGSLRAAGAPATAAELVPGAYQDVNPALYPFAERSLLAHLLKLERDGRARRDGSQRWALA